MKPKLLPGQVTIVDDNAPMQRPSLPAPHPSTARFYELLKEIGELHAQKQKDYGRDDDPFANVRASEEWGVAAWVGR